MSIPATLPPGWVWTTIGQVAETTSGGTPSRKEPSYYGGNIPWLKSGELNDGLVTDVEECITENGLRYSSAKRFAPGAALVALYGATVGKTGILGLEAATNQAVCGIFPLKNSFTAQYMVYWLQCNRRKLVDLSSGGAQPNISQGIIRSFPFPLAPLPEQRRIVAAIETHFSRLDAAVAKLKRIRTNLKRYRAAVLKAACEGRLVPQDPGDEPADHLLARILAERRRQWQAANPGKKYTDPAAPQRDDLPPLPSGWVWVRVEQIIAEQPTNGRSATTVENGFPVLRLTAIQHGTINLSERKLGAITAKDATPFFVQEEDFFISRGNGSLHLVGRCGLVEQSGMCQEW
jgi:type I restriction enzyme S subunit